MPSSHVTALFRAILTPPWGKINVLCKAAPAFPAPADSRSHLALLVCGLTTPVHPRGPARRCSCLGSSAAGSRQPGLLCRMLSASAFASPLPLFPSLFPPPPRRLPCLELGSLSCSLNRLYLGLPHQSYCAVSDFLATNLRPLSSGLRTRPLSSGRPALGAVRPHVFSARLVGGHAGQVPEAAPVTRAAWASGAALGGDPREVQPARPAESSRCPRGRAAPAAPPPPIAHRAAPPASRGDGALPPGRPKPPHQPGQQQGRGRYRRSTPASRRPLAPSPRDTR
ncbi:PREDICTED: uncharacterized protein LOC106146875 [Chinchilla lanigera]|uniref:uncharacterized protein LOC106146875 n=1 Tax=Chinchilla lanigera TaxID=34839 RepID=UPI00069758B0|nr:PREDICTED: uncharacterized protein LOC106146875 [Chinchilla lanigera]